MNVNKISFIKKLIYYLFIPIFLIEIILYKFFKKKNSKRSHLAMIFFFGQFGIKFNDCLSKFLCKNKSINVKDLKSFLIINKNTNKVLNDLNRNGYSIVKNVIEKKTIEKIKFSLKNIKGAYTSDEFALEDNKNEFYDYENPKGVKFVYNGNDLLANLDIQNLAFDKFFINIAKDYLKCVPILDIVGAWWSAPSDKPDHNAAQLWHFDMDRPRWLKVFIYLTDCNELNGPHEFIEGSHRVNGIPKNIRTRGYVRLDDKEILRHYKNTNIKKFTAKEGDLLIEDTIGLHRGKQLFEGRRLLLNFQYSSCCFGSTLPNFKIPEQLNSNLSIIKKKIPLISSRLI
jgi:hypothetical protein